MFDLDIKEILIYIKYKKGVCIRMKRFITVLFLFFLVISAGCGGGGGGGGDDSAEGSSGSGGLTSTVTGAYVVIAWNDLGMHCMDGKDYSVFSILPPYNNLHAQVIRRSDGRLVEGQIYLTYQSYPDPSTSKKNTISSTKTNFWDYVSNLFGYNPSPDYGLNLSDPSKSNPTPSDLPAEMSFNSQYRWWEAEGIPLTPYNDDGTKNYYPMVKVVARDFSGSVLAETLTVLPVSDELDCSGCHSSQSGNNDARPSQGWVNDPQPERDWKLNILRLHDEKNPDAITSAGLSARYQGTGLFDTVQTYGQPILCADCHSSNALQAKGVSGVPSLTRAIHHRHSGVKDPSTGKTLDSIPDRRACYKCHPGSKTRCLRGAMGGNNIECQDCHGSMSAVADPSRQGWLSMPACQYCHNKTGPNGSFTRYKTVFSSGTTLRTVYSNRFATDPDTPMKGISLYRFSTGHGGLQCEACHGSTHAIYPSTHGNDNIQSINLQGYSGTISNCATCHQNPPVTAKGGPHGMHIVGQSWVKEHKKHAKSALSDCAQCHGADYRGSPLSEMWQTRTLSVEDGSKTLLKGHRVSCYDCHNGPNGGD